MKPISKFLGLILVFFSFGDLYGQSLGVYKNYTIPQIGGNAIIQPSVPPSGITKSSVKVSGHFRGKVYIDPVTGKIHVNNAYPNGDYKVDVFAPNGLTTNFTLTVAGSECKYKGRFQFSREIIDIPSKASRAVDINRDGLSDLLLLRQDIGGVTLLLNSKTGFVKKTEIILGFVPELFDLGDLNNDGLLDIVATNNVEQSILIIYGSDNSTFLPPVTIRPLATIVEGNFLVENPNKLIVQDINNDGMSDIVIFSPNQGIVFIGLGKEDNTFDFNQSIYLQHQDVKGDLEIADLFGDSKLEIVVVVGVGGNMYLINQQQNNFRLLTSIVIQFGGSGIPDIELIDVNSDSYLDIYYTDGINGSSLYLSTTNLVYNFLPAENFVLGPNNGGVYLRPLDLNGDKYLDYFSYISPNYGFYGTTIGNGFITNPEITEPIDIGQEFSDVTILDVNGDRLLDVCISDISGSTLVLIGTQNYFSEKIIDPGFITDVGNLLAADFSNDGFADIIVSNTLLPEFSIYKGNSIGSHDFFRSISLPLVGVEVGPRTMEMGDINNDGILDLLIAMGSDSVFIYKGIGQGDFELLQLDGFATTIKHNSSVMRFRVMDYNNDGFKDIIFLNQTSICVALGNGDFTFKNVITEILNIDVLQITGFEVRDITNDGFPELFFSDASADHLVIYTGNKNAQFAYSNRIIIPGVEGFSIGDYNNDLIDDVVVGVPQNGLVLYRGTGSLSFVNDKLLYGIDPYNLVGKDLDGDLLNELIFWNNGGLMQVLFFDKNRQQMLEQTTNFYSPIQGPIFFGDFGNVLNTVPDGITDIYFRTEAGITKLLINESLNNRIFDQNTPITELVLCNNQNYFLKISDNSSTSVQWESSFDGETYGAITGQNSYQINYTQTLPLSFLRAKLTNTSYCSNASPYYTKPLRIQYQDYSQFNPLNDFYTSCDSLVTINIQPGFKNYQWSNGIFGNEVNLSKSSNISLRITDSLGCSIVDTAIVTVANIKIIENDTTVCKNTEVKLHVDSLGLKNSIYLNDLNNGLLFYAPMDANSIDVTDNYSIKSENNILYGLDRHGNQFGSAIFTDTSRLQYDYLKTLIDSSFSLSAWVYFESPGNVIQLSKNGIFANVQEPIFEIESSLVDSVTGIHGISAPQIYEYRKWYHVAQTFNNNQHKLYINGSLIYTQLVPFINHFLPTPILLGGNYQPGSQLGIFNGKLDDIAVWNRELSEYEISVIANNSYTIEWSDGQTGNSITVFPDSTTNYSAKMTIGNTVCYDSVLVRLNPIDTVLQLSSFLPKCFLDTLTITASPGSTYQWFKNDSLLVSSTLNIFSTPDSGIFQVLIRDVNGCVDSSSKIDVRNITISASFSVNDTTQLLSGNSFVFSNGSSVGVGGLRYVWDFGDGLTSTEVSPVHVYDSVGVYRVKLLSVSDQGCSDSSFLELAVNSSLDAMFSVSDTTLCLVGNRFVFTDQSVTDGGVVSYRWDFGDGVVSSVQNPVHSYGSAGDYAVRLLVVSGGVRDSSEVIVRVDSMPNVRFSVSDTLQCLSGNSYVFNNLTVVPTGEVYSYRWDFGDGDSSLLASPTHAYAGVGSYNVRLIGVNGSGCADTSVVGIEVYGMPVSSFSVNDTTQLLSGNSFVFSNGSSVGVGGLRYVWDFGDGLTSTEVSPVHVYDSVGVYRVKLLSVSDQGCSDSSFLELAVNSSLDAMFSVSDTTQCLVGNSFVFTDQSVTDGGVVSYRWDFGDGSVSSVQNPVHSYGSAGDYAVRLLVVSGGVRDSSEVIVRVDSMPNVRFSVSDTLQCLSGNSYVFNNLTVVPGGEVYSYRWDFGDGDSSLLASPTHAYAGVGSYNVRLIGVNGSGCADTSVVGIEVYGMPVSSFSVNDTTQLLSGNSFVFSNGSSVGVGGLRYVWDFGDGLTSTEVSPVHVYDSVGVYRVKLLSVSDQGCSDSSFLELAVNSSLDAMFSVSDTTQCLVGNSFVFTDQSVTDGGVVSYRWDFGDGSVSSVQNPVHSYGSAGDYAVRLLVVSGGVRDSSEVIVRVDSMPNVRFSVSDTLQCLSGNSYVFNNLTVVPGGEVYSYRWDFGDGDSSVLSSPTHAYAVVGSYNVRLIGVNGSGCADTSFNMIRVLSEPNVNFLVNDSIQCLSDNRFILTNTTVKEGVDMVYKWDFGDGNISNIENPVHVYEKSGKYIINLIAQNSIGCIDSFNLRVNIFSKPVSQFSVNDTLQCITNNLFRFIDSTKAPIGEKYSLKWNFGDGIESLNTNPVHSYITPGSYSVKLISSVSEACIDSFSVKVIVAEQPSFLKYDPVDVVSGNATKLQARNIGVKYQWIPSLGLSSSLVYDPMVNLINEQKYVIKITTEAKCDVYDSLLVRVFKNYDIFVPKGFTPNNDGKNDRLYPFLVGIKSLQVFKIFDRWGNLIYNNSNINSNTGWDGNVKGKLAPVGVYVWVAEGIDLDNNVIKRMGNTALIR